MDREGELDSQVLPCVGLPSSCRLLMSVESDVMGSRENTYKCITAGLITTELREKGEKKRGSHFQVCDLGSHSVNHFPQINFPSQRKRI